jgi:hypothetical protein
MTVLSDADLYLRGAETLLASWEEYARGAAGAVVQRSPGVAAAVFPSGPERAVYNNALLERDLAAAERADALEAMEAVYAAAGVSRFAAWVHESDQAMRADLQRRGYTLDSSTRAMGMALDGIRLPRPELELGSTDWDEYLRIFGLPPGLLSRADHSVFHLLVARLDGENVATAMAFDHGGDLQRWNAGACPPARTGHRADRHPPARRGRARMSDGEPAVDPDGRARVRRRGLPRPRPHPRVRTVGRRRGSYLASKPATRSFALGRRRDVLAPAPEAIGATALAWHAANYFDLRHNDTDAPLMTAGLRGHRIRQARHLGAALESRRALTCPGSWGAETRIRIVSRRFVPSGDALHALADRLPPHPLLVISRAGDGCQRSYCLRAGGGLTGGGVPSEAGAAGKPGAGPAGEGRLGREPARRGKVRFSGR